MIDLYNIDKRKFLLSDVWLHGYGQHKHLLLYKTHHKAHSATDSEFHEQKYCCYWCSGKLLMPLLSFCVSGLLSVLYKSV